MSDTDKERFNIEIGRILGTQEMHGTILIDIKTTLGSINDKISDMKVDINGVGEKTRSCQYELIEHKKNEKYVITLMVAISSAFASVVNKFWR